MEKVEINEMVEFAFVEQSSTVWGKEKKNGRSGVLPQNWGGTEQNCTVTYLHGSFNRRPIQQTTRNLAHLATVNFVGLDLMLLSMGANNNYSDTCVQKSKERIKELIGRANRCGNFLGHAEICDHGRELSGCSLIGS
ncbi:hypothetical protein TNCV_8961 [Trichonephila clavipes]|nr:hypothetical protein TNCV_8961 [Trichonephila clavipes]